jgi:hypothetical protein
MNNWRQILSWEEEPPKYKASGVVLGYTWNNVLGAYPSIELEGYNSIEDLTEDANKKLEEGGLDSGMGFQSLKGAMLFPIEVIGPYYKKPLDPIFIGKLEPREVRFLIENY